MNESPLYAASAKRTRTVARAAAMLFWICGGCGKDETTGPSTEFDLASLSGTWLGSRDIVQTGQCSINGTDSLATSVSLGWTVDSSGNAVITPIAPLSTHRWSGRVESDLSVALWKNYEVVCGNVSRADSAFYEGTIVVVDGRRGLVVEAHEAWCPSSGCFFRNRYTLAQE
jgi:hypothetical protein